MPSDKKLRTHLLPAYLAEVSYVLHMPTPVFPPSPLFRQCESQSAHIHISLINSRSHTQNSSIQQNILLLVLVLQRKILISYGQKIIHEIIPGSENSNMKKNV
eukprot:TRINITY_DN1471_c0_g1_i5.p1 TRINITY_DN1471_c0_g1~~TRINITY_DN1471_c0_g1_i5.p1  ORF type:complete len:103 (+),score=12.37 TRINITY_DN1471_c0_g1_i5:394-702(+)